MAEAAFQSRLRRARYLNMYKDGPRGLIRTVYVFDVFRTLRGIQRASVIKKTALTAHVKLLSVRGKCRFSKSRDGRYSVGHMLLHVNWNLFWLEELTPNKFISSTPWSLAFNCLNWSSKACSNRILSCFWLFILDSF